jgi:hypothetical protein
VIGKKSVLKEYKKFKTINFLEYFSDIIATNIEDIRGGSVMNVKLILLFIVGVIASGCNTLSGKVDTQTRAEQFSGYTYYPIDPISIKYSNAIKNCICDQVKDNTCSNYNSAKILKELPHNSVRVFTQGIDRSGNITIAPFQVESDGTRYKLIIDFITHDVDKGFKVLIKATERNDNTKIVKLDSIQTNVDYDYVVEKLTDKNKDLIGSDYTSYYIPLYVGTGLRITSDYVYNKSGGSINGLGALTTSIDNKEISGSLVVQTIGANSKAISGLLPIQSDLSKEAIIKVTTALSAIKTLLYNESTIIKPAVVGIYLPFKADQELAGKIISKIIESENQWNPQLCNIGE